MRSKRKSLNAAERNPKLEALGFTTYRDYLRSPHWQAVRKQFIRAKAVEGVLFCACGSTNKVVVHHKTYARLGRERQLDLVLVCERCHSAIHKLHKANKKLSLAKATDTVLQKNVAPMTEITGSYLELYERNSY